MHEFCRRSARPGDDRRVTGAFSLRAAGEDGVIEGYGSVFGVVDSYGDVVEKGAFAASLHAHRAAGTMPAMLWQHNPDDPLGVWEEMSEDAHGLKVKGRIVLETARGREARALLKAGALNGLSIGFVATDKSWNDRDGTRTLNAIDLWEVSLVTFPANQQARLSSVKAADMAALRTIREAEEVLCGTPDFSERSAKAFIAAVKRIANDERDAREAVAKAQHAADRLLKSFKGH